MDSWNVEGAGTGLRALFGVPGVGDQANRSSIVDLQTRSQDARTGEMVERGDEVEQ